jgi:hypothetical protein
MQLVPGREGTAAKKRFGGPLAEVDRESHAVAVVAGEDHYLFAARVAPEDGAHFLREENRPAPAVRDPHGCKSGMQVANSAFKPAKTLGGFALVNFIAAQVARRVPDGAVAERKS